MGEPVANVSISINIVDSEYTVLSPSSYLIERGTAFEIVCSGSSSPAPSVVDGVKVYIDGLHLNTQSDVSKIFSKYDQCNQDPNDMRTTECVYTTKGSYADAYSGEYLCNIRNSDVYYIT